MNPALRMDRKPCLGNEDSRSVDRKAIDELGVPGTLLMEKAGTGAAVHILGLMREKGLRRCLVFCGKGNNGGDGYVIAGWLFGQGVDVKVFTIAKEEEIEGDALHFYRNMRDKGVSCTHLVTATTLEPWLEGPALWVDALFGTGLRSELKGLGAEILSLLASRKGEQVLCAVDIPSGISGSNGLRRGKIPAADRTYTMGYHKWGLYLQGAKFYCGGITMIPLPYPAEAYNGIGQGNYLCDESYVSGLLKPIHPDSHKYTRGQVGILGASATMPGATAMAGKAAFRSGCGMVQIFGESQAHGFIRSFLPEAIVHEYSAWEGEDGDSGEITKSPLYRRTGAWLMGPGLGRDADKKRYVQKAIDAIEGPWVLDADALYHIGDAAWLQGRNTAVVITPHYGEFARLFPGTGEDLSEKPVETARAMAMKYGIIIHLKGAGSLTALPDGEIYLHPVGNAGMATAGSGDVLAGMAAGFLAQGQSASEAMLIAAHIHGEAGDRAAAELGMRSMMATDILNAIPGAMKKYESGLRPINPQFNECK